MVVQTTIESLPPELIIAIMHAAVTDSSDPWVISHVCHTWRKISRAIPDLWNTIYFSYGDEEIGENDEDEDELVPFSFPFQLEAQLLLSDQVPLDITITLGHNMSSEQRRHAECVLDIICEHYLRWNKLDLKMPPSSWDIFQFPSLFRLSLPALVSLRIRLMEEYWSSDDPLVVAITAEQAPRLVSVVLAVAPFERDGNVLLDLPWCQLRSVVFDHIPLLQTQNAIHQLQNVKSLTLAQSQRSIFALQESLAAVSNTTLPSLTELHFLWEPFEPMFQLLCEELTLPCLQIIKISATNIGISTLQPITRLVQRSNCSLLELELETCSIKPSHLCEMFTSLKDLRRLSLSNMYNFRIHSVRFSADAILSAITQGSLPLLEMLNLKYVRVDVGLLSGLLVARQKALQSVSVLNCFPPEGTTIAKEKDWVASLSKIAQAAYGSDLQLFVERQ